MRSNFYEIKKIQYKTIKEVSNEISIILLCFFTLYGKIRLLTM